MPRPHPKFPPTPETPDTLREARARIIREAEDLHKKSREIVRHSYDLIERADDVLKQDRGSPQGGQALPEPERYKHLGTILFESACVLGALAVLAIIGWLIGGGP
jgi:hypothetical protein